MPVANYVGSLPLDDRQQLEWSLLDTVDWLSPEFDNPQTAATVREWLRRAGLERIEVLKAGHLVGRATPAGRGGIAPMGLVVGIDASRNRSGGAKAHLLGIIRDSDPRAHGIELVHVWLDLLQRRLGKRHDDHIGLVAQNGRAWAVGRCPFVRAGPDVARTQEHVRF